MKNVDATATNTKMGEPTDDRKFGWPSFARKDKLDELLKASSGKTQRIEYQGRVMDLPIIQVPIGLPRYRLANGRTSSAQREWLATHKEKPSTFFTADPELREAQEEQHRLLFKLKTRDLEDKFKDPAQKQVDPIILDSEGFVVNGNTRLAYWRSLYYAEPQKFEHYAYIDAILLPSGDEKDIDRLEGKLQLQRDIRAEYIWHAEAEMVKRRIAHGLLASEIVALYGWKDSEVARRIAMWDLGAEYLKSRGKEDMWSTIDSYDYAFGTLVDMREKIAGADNKTLFKEAAFLLIDNRDKVGSSGSVHDAIRNLKEHFVSVKKSLEQQFKPEPAKLEDKAEDLFGPVPTQPKEEEAQNAIPLAKEISKEANVANAVETIVETIDSEIQKRKDEKNANYLMKCCKDAQAALQNAVMSGLTADANLSGVDAQLDKIQELAATIRKHLSEYAKD